MTNGHTVRLGTTNRSWRTHTIGGSTVLSFYEEGEYVETVIGRPSMPMHVIGNQPPAPRQEPFGDVRDVITACPNFGGHGYATLDLFTVRHKLISELDPPPTSVFEFGSLLGYFLITAIEASPAITRAGWIDTETDYNGSNELCAENVRWTFKRTHRAHSDPWYSTRTRDCVAFGQADLVQVDGAHTYPDCLTDLVWALELGPKTIFVDDYKAITAVKAATDDFAKWIKRDVEYHETVNGLAVLRRDG